PLLRGPAVGPVIRHGLPVQLVPEGLGGDDAHRHGRYLEQFGYNLAFYLAGLQAIEASVLEAASVDGAGPIRRFFAVTFPLLSPVTFFLFTLNMTFSFFDTFGLVHSVTQGGPGDAPLFLVYRAWKAGFDGLQLGF